MTAQQGIIATLIATLGSAFLSWAWFSLYHGMQKITARWIRDHMRRSFLWMIVFLTGLPFIFSPTVGALYFVGFDQQQGALTSIFGMILVVLGPAFLFLGWLLSYLPQRDTLKKIGAWGMPETDGG